MIAVEVLVALQDKIEEASELAVDLADRIDDGTEIADLDRTKILDVRTKLADAQGLVGYPGVSHKYTETAKKFEVGE